MIPPRDAEADAIRVLVELHLEGPDEWLPEHYDTAEVAARRVAEWLRRVGRSPRATPRPKPTQRRKLDPPELVAGKAAVKARSGGRCEAQTPWCEGQATQVHHISGRVGEGCHDDVNLLDVCGQGNVTGCHGYLHQHAEEAYEKGWLKHRNGQVRP